MNYPDNLFPAPWSLFALGVVVALGWRLARRTDWRALRVPLVLNLWLAACVALTVLWSLKVGVRPGLDFHMLGATALTLMFGPGLALAALALVLAAVTISGQAGWEAYSLNLLIMGAAPVAISYALFRVSDRYLPHHLFVYLFIDAFLAAGLAMILCSGLSVLALSAAGVYPLAQLAGEYWAYSILMGWSEALLTGMAVTLMAVFRPRWVSSFDDARYLGN